ncbi:MAG: NAD-dependent epimerase/dehydratase family protein, partial [Bacteroidota bacterium]
MKILIAGNLSYIAPSIITQLNKKFPNAELIGYDIGYFVDAYKHLNLIPDIQVDKQIYGDIRKITAEV